MRQRKFPKQNPYLMSIVLIILISILVGLSITSVRLFAESTSSAVNNEILRGMQQSVEQAKNNLDYRLQQTADSARTLLGTIYPYLNSDAGTEEQLEEYSEMTRVLNEYIGKYMIARVRLYVSDNKMYAHQNETFYSLAQLEEDADFQALLGDRRGGVFWQDGIVYPTINGENQLAISCVAVVSSIKDYNQIVGTLYLDINIEDISQIFLSGGDDSAELYLVDASGKVIAHSDTARIGLMDLTKEQVAQLHKTTSGTISGDNLVAYEQIDTNGWYLIASADPASVLRPSGSTAAGSWSF